MYTPLISILVPTYNRPAYLLLTIKSILSQPYSNYEIIICDNSDNEETEKVIKDLIDKSKIIYFKNEKNIGVVNNFNKCLSLANGDFIHFLSDDDLLLPNALLNKVDLIKETKAEFVFSKFNEIDENGNVINTQQWGNEHSTFQFFESQKISNISFNAYKINREVLFNDLYNKWNFICLSSVMISKEVCKKTGIWDINLPIICDWDYWLRITKSHEAFYIDENIIEYRRHNANITQTQTNYESLKKQLLIIKQNLNPEMSVAKILKEVKMQTNFLKPMPLYLKIVPYLKNVIRKSYKTLLRH